MAQFNQARTGATNVTNPPSGSTGLAYDSNGWPYIIQPDGTKVPQKFDQQWDYNWENGVDPFDGGDDVVTTQVGCWRIGLTDAGEYDLQAYVAGSTNAFVSRNLLAQ